MLAQNLKTSPILWSLKCHLGHWIQFPPHCRNLASAWTQPFSEPIPLWSWTQYLSRIWLMPNKLEQFFPMILKLLLLMHFKSAFSFCNSISYFLLTLSLQSDSIPRYFSQVLYSYPIRHHSSYTSAFDFFSLSE